MANARRYANVESGHGMGRSLHSLSNSSIGTLIKKGRRMIQQDDLKTEELISIENLLKSVKDFDRLILEAVDAGIESGRSIGVIEAYNILIREGYGDVAELLMNIISDDDPSAKTKLES